MKMNTPSRWMRRRVRGREGEMMAGLAPPEWTMSSCGTRNERYENARCSTTGWLIALRTSESIRFPTLWNLHLTPFPLPSLLACPIVSFCPMPPSLFSDFPLYTSIFFSFSLLHKRPAVFLPLQISTQALLTRRDVPPVHTTDLSIGTKFQPRALWYSKYAQDITVGWSSFEHWRRFLTEKTIGRRIFAVRMGRIFQAKRVEG